MSLFRPQEKYVAELRLPCAGVHPRISFTRQRQVRELLEIRRLLGELTSDTGRTEFSLGTVHST